MFKRSHKVIQKQKGFILLEVLVAASIIVMSVLAASNVAQKSISASRQAFHSAQASFLLEEGAEAMRITRDNGWSNLTNLTSGVEYYPLYCNTNDPAGNDPKCLVYPTVPTWVLVPMNNSSPYFLTNQSVTVGNFIRKIVVSDVYRDSSTQDIVTSGGVLDGRTKFITVTVSWNQAGNTVSKTLSFYLADIFS